MAKLSSNTGKKMIKSSKVFVPTDGSKVFFKLARAAYLKDEVQEERQMKYSACSVHFFPKVDERGKPVKDEDGKVQLVPIPCFRSLGHAECPFCAVGFKKHEELTREGVNTQNHPALKGWMATRRYDVPVIMADDTITFMSVGKSVINDLFGSYNKAKKWQLGLVDKMLKDGDDPYDVTQSTGWLSIHRIGDPKDHNSIKYVVEQATVKDGKTIKSFEHQCGDEVLDFDDDNMKDPREPFKKAAWTLEEAQAFIDSGCTKFPERAPQVEDLDGFEDAPAASTTPAAQKTGDTTARRQKLAAALEESDD